MNDLTNLESLDLALPSTAYIMGAILFGLIGYAAYRRGKALELSALKWSGVALMLYPYAISQTWLLWGIGVALCGWIYTLWN